MLMENTEGRLPAARTERLLCRELPGGDLILYDTDRHRAHSLNRTAAFIWQQCDGQTNIAALAARLQALDVPTDKGLVWLALEQLEKAHLLQEKLVRPADAARLSRRGVIRKLGYAGGLLALLPMVDSIAAPVPAAADSMSAECPPPFLGKGAVCTPGPCEQCKFGRCLSVLYSGFVCC
jgi:hypothetical protein